MFKMQNVDEDLCEIILNLIPIGKDNAVFLKDLSSTTGIDTRTIKFIIQKLRKDGYAICSTTYNGYWLAENEYDLQETINQLKSRINTLQETINALSGYRG